MRSNLMVLYALLRRRISEEHVAEESLHGTDIKSTQDYGRLYISVADAKLPYRFFIYRIWKELLEFVLFGE